eukprot:CAMPEP_0170549830 /NCGR_PEP_ID=MMETSP0211-20121228/7964_1 /TAXON_ID=311385 /ORGANISM="Pseudokeronopsis sp., Strain OXSARD2" /LENGTH=175 /DNA_ID=CAMNT_0010856071 /DNA_START=223 /DNA_END=746 /DNA_ORIENTATION=+
MMKREGGENDGSQFPSFTQQDSDEVVGFDRLLAQQSYSEIEVHAIRLHFHSIMMRCGVEKTNETSDSLLENEERWMNKQLPSMNNSLKNMTLEELRKVPTVLSRRNDLVLPRYHKVSQQLEKEGTTGDLICGLFVGFIFTIFFFLVYFFRNGSDEEGANLVTKKKKLGVYVGAFL